MSYDHSIQRVKDARKEFDKANARVAELAAVVGDAAAVLENPQTSRVSDQTGVMGEKTISSAKFILEASKWPKIEDIDAAIRQYQKARSSVQAGIDALSGEDRVLAESLRV